MKKKLAYLVGALVVFFAVSSYVVFIRPKIYSLHVDIPDQQQTGQLAKLDQGWTDEIVTQFHHTPQGTQIMPYPWFAALEEPSLNPLGGAKFARQEYLGRFGFLQGSLDPKLNPDRLPVGFARDDDFRDPISGHTYPVVGFTCAACHTAELLYGTQAVRVEGGPAMINLDEFLKAVGNALILTDLMPFRYARFERNVLGPEATPSERVALRQEFQSFLKSSVNEMTQGNNRGVYNNPEGFGRTDALARIGNIVFAADMNNWDNLAPTDAPVRFPQIWDASWFTWVQYNASISNPMERNIGEALGVKAIAKLSGCCADKLQSTVRFHDLWKLEKWLSGDQPYAGLNSPKWPSIFPPLDTTKVLRGKQLYQELCVGCHLPPVEELKESLLSGKPPWVKRDPAQPHPFLQNREIPLEYIGTDPQQALNFYHRTADSGDLKKGCLTAAQGLDYLTKSMAMNFYTNNNFSATTQKEWSGWQDPSAEGIRATKVYRPRPLNGAWTLGTYLHNGSIPNLYELLSPVTERSTVFWVGSRKFDPVKVGYESSLYPGGFKFDVRKPGNSNRGHEFNGDGKVKGNGIIGRLLPPDDRWALIEYLKSL